MLRRWRQQQERRAARQADRRQPAGLCRQWVLLVGRAAKPPLTPPDPTALRSILPPDDAFWADPFVWCRDGRCWVFFEDYPYTTGIGRISAIELDRALRPIGAAVPVLEGPEHLSYPYLVEYERELYMIPEKAHSGSLDAYRCLNFPYRWQHAATLLQGERIADASLFPYQDRWWLLGAVKRRGLQLSESLFAYFADSPLSNSWTAHPANPIVRDFSRARPAGRVLVDGQGRLLRPSQNCVPRYGHGLNLSEILELSPQRYRERVLWHRSGEQMGGWQGLHHMDWRQGIVVMDAQRLQPVRDSAAPD
jgi:hypothetical protein